MIEPPVILIGLYGGALLAILLGLAAVVAKLMSLTSQEMQNRHVYPCEICGALCRATDLTHVYLPDLGGVAACPACVSLGNRPPGTPPG